MQISVYVTHPNWIVEIDGDWFEMSDNASPNGVNMYIECPVHYVNPNARPVRLHPDNWPDGLRTNIRNRVHQMQDFKLAKALYNYARWNDPNGDFEGLTTRQLAEVVHEMFLED